MSRLLSLEGRRKLALVILEKLRIQNPDPRCELVYHSPFQLLTSVLLSAQATDKQVNKVMIPLYAETFSPETIRTWGETALLQRIRSIGLAPTKAKNLHKLAWLLKSNFNDSIPTTREDLESLPGVGRKTANVILGELHQLPTLAVDTHVFRVGQRLGLHQEKSAEKAEQVLLKIVPASFLPAAHHWFILLGRYTCKARRPDCENCVLNTLCPSAALITSSSLPPKSLRESKAQVTEPKRIGPNS